MLFQEAQVQVVDQLLGYEPVALDELARNSSAHALDRPELVAGAMREGLDALGELAGAVAPDEIIGRVFAGFCVGK